VTSGAAGCRLKPIVGARFRDVKVLLADARISTGADETKEDPL